MSAPRTPQPARDLVQAQARRMVQAAHAVFGDAVADLATDPCEVLESWGEVDFRLVPEVATTTGMSSADGGCSVAGAYLESEKPGVLPIVQVSASASPGRRSFTALHELGHHLQRTDIDLAAVLWEQTSIDMFEDLACDAFAAGMLLPDRTVDTIIDAKGPTARDVVSLYQRAEASRSAVCVRAAQRLPAPGHVLTVDADGTVFFAAANRMPPVRKGSDQSQVDVVARGLRGGSSRGRGRFHYRDGILGEELFIQTAAMDGYLLVVAVTDHAPWEGFALPSRDVGPRAGSYECPHDGCGATYTSFEPRCPRCNVAPCTECRRCACTSAVAERTCTSCWLVKPAAGFEGDRCADCSA